MVIAPRAREASVQILLQLTAAALWTSAAQDVQAARSMRRAAAFRIDALGHGDTRSPAPSHPSPSMRAISLQSRSTRSTSHRSLCMLLHHLRAGWTMLASWRRNSLAWAKQARIQGCCYKRTIPLGRRFSCWAMTAPLSLMRQQIVGAIPCPIVKTRFFTKAFTVLDRACNGL